MSVRQAILIAGAMALIIVGVVSRRQSASPMPESGGDATPTAGKQRVSAERLFSQRRSEARSPVSSENDVDRVRQLAEGNPPAAARWAVQFPASAARVEAIKAVAIAWANQDLAGAVEGTGSCHAVEGRS